MNSKRLNTFLTGIMAYNVILSLAFLNVIPSRYAQILEFPICIYLLMYLRFFLLPKIRVVGKLLFLALAIWTLYIVVNFDFSFFNIGRVIIRNQGIVSYMMIFLVPFFAKIQYLDNILSFLYKWNKIYLSLLCFFVPLSLYYFMQGEIMIAQTNFEALHTYIGGGLIFLIFFSYRFTNKERNVLYLSSFVTIICAGLFARRGVILLYVATYIIWFIINITRGQLSRKIRIVSQVIILLLILFYFVSVFGETLFPFLYSRITDDTRSFTELELIEDLTWNGGMMYGRGILGTYNSIIETGTDMDRIGIETGYLNMILHGGIVYVVLYSLFVIPPILLGLFHSGKNATIKYLSLFSILFVAYFNVASSNMSLSIRYFLFLYAILICYQKSLDKKFSNND